MTRISATALLLALAAPTTGAAELVDAGEPFGELPLIDEVVCGEASDTHEFKESARGASRTERILDATCRVLPTACGAWRQRCPLPGPWAAPSRLLLP